jgi:hypothetical protein
LFTRKVSRKRRGIARHAPRLRDSPENENCEMRFLG